MITLREALSSLGRGATCGALVVTAAITTQCTPTPAPAAVYDPMLLHIQRCREILHFIDSKCPATDEEIDALCVPLHDAYNVLARETPEVTTCAGAIEALRFCGSNYVDTAEEFVGPVIGAVLAYLEGRPA